MHSPLVLSTAVLVHQQYLKMKVAVLDHCELRNYAKFKKNRHSFDVVKKPSIISLVAIVEVEKL
jgi:hypothetical protein